MTKPQSNTETAIDRISKLEVLLTKLDSDMAQAESYHHNQLVTDCLEKSRKALRSAMDSLLTKELSESCRMIGVSWLYFNMGRKVLDGDAIEHFLGENDYLKLTEERSDIEVKLERDMSSFEQLILKLRASAAEGRKVK